MVLGFKEQFVGQILNGTKIHTIRFDNKNRWKVGNKIHFATGVRTKKYRQFKLGECMSIQKILIIRPSKDEFEILVDERRLSIFECFDLSIRDGFTDIKEFIEWFLPIKGCSFEYGPHTYRASLIHWTDFKY